MRNRPLLEWDWVRDHLDEVRTATYEHLRLTIIAVVFGLVLAGALSMIGLRWRRALGPITWVTGVLYTIPSLAAFTFLVPVFGLGSTVAAEIVLVSYTLLILIRNIVAGIDGVDPAVRTAAAGMGYTPSQRLLRIELPLAVPAILAGVRIATVTTVGLVTVTGLIGLGGYGGFIDAGLKRQFPTQVVLGGGLSVVMAVVLDVLLLGVERLATPWRRGARPPRRLTTTTRLPIGAAGSVYVDEGAAS